MISKKKTTQTVNDKLIAVRGTFDQYNLISSLHSFMSVSDRNYENLLPPLNLLSIEKKRELLSKLDKLQFIPTMDSAA